MKIKIKGDRTKIFKIILLSPVYLIIVSAYSSIKNEYKKILTLLNIIVLFCLKNKKHAIKAVTGIKKGRITLLLSTGIVTLIQFLGQLILSNMHLIKLKVDQVLINQELDH